MRRKLCLFYYRTRIGFIKKIKFICIKFTLVYLIYLAYLIYYFSLFSLFNLDLNIANFTL